MYLFDLLATNILREESYTRLNHVKLPILSGCDSQIVVWDPRRFPILFSGGHKVKTIFTIVLRHHLCFHFHFLNKCRVEFSRGCMMCDILTN